MKIEKKINKNIALLNDKIKDFQKNNGICFAQPQFLEIFESNLSNIVKLIHKIQSLYFNEIDSEIFKDYYNELIYLLFQMELI